MKITLLNNFHPIKDLIFYRFFYAKGQKDILLKI